HAEPGRALVVLALVFPDFIVFVNLSGDRFSGATWGTGSQRQGDHRGQTEYDAQNKPSEPCDMPADDYRRQSQHRISRNAPKSGWKRPRPDARQRGGKCGAKKSRKNPQEAAPFIPDRPVRDQPPAEQSFGNQKQNGREPQQLHRQVGENSSGKTQQIMY